jgi:hypothetical protein
MKNIKGVPRKAKYEVLSVEVVGYDLRGMSRYMQADSIATRMVGGVPYTKQEILVHAMKNRDTDNMNGLRPHIITVRVPVRQWARKNRSHKPNDWKDRTISTMAVDEIEAYQIAKFLIQAHWHKAFNLDRYARR